METIKGTTLNDAPLVWSTKKKAEYERISDTSAMITWTEEIGNSDLSGYHIY